MYSLAMKMYIVITHQTIEEQVLINKLISKTRVLVLSGLGGCLIDVSIDILCQILLYVSMISST